MLNRVTILINFTLGTLSILSFAFFESTDNYIWLINDVLIVVLIFVMTVLTITNTPKWYKFVKNKNETVSLIHIMVGISYMFVFVSLII